MTEISPMARHRKARFYQQSTKWIPAWVLAVVLAGLYGESWLTAAVPVDGPHCSCERGRMGFRSFYLNSKSRSQN